MNYRWIILIILTIVLGGVAYFSGNNSAPKSETSAPTPPSQSEDAFKHFKIP